MVYLVLKELAGTADDVIMVTSSIMKDTSVGSDVLYRANAIRALCRIIDVSGRLVTRILTTKADTFWSLGMSCEDGRAKLKKPHLPPNPRQASPWVSIQLEAIQRWLLRGRIS